jgi:hypothetical protein
MSIPQWFAGQVMTADGLNARHPRLVTQVNDQAINVSTTLIDSEIIFTPEPNAEYAYELFISYSATINSDMKWAWRAAGALFASFTLGYATSAAAGVNTGSDVVMRRPGNTTPRVAGGSNSTSPPADFHSAYDRGTFSTDGSVAEVAMQFAQNTSHADQTIMRGGNQTRLLYWRIG